MKKGEKKGEEEDALKQSNRAHKGLNDKVY